MQRKKIQFALPPNGGISVDDIDFETQDLDVIAIDNDSQVTEQAQLAEDSSTVASTDSEEDR